MKFIKMRSAVPILALGLIVIGLIVLLNSILNPQPEVQPHSPPAESGSAAASQPFGSTADTVFDIIRTSDPSTFSCLEYVGLSEHQIWDKRVKGEPIINAFLFRARYSDGFDIKVAINSEFGSVAAAQDEAERYTGALGRLPTRLRQGIKTFSVHKGDEGFHAGAGKVVVYSEMTDDRLSYHHLEESLFHEAVHASLDNDFRLAPEWLNAQRRDGKFLTSYAKASPEREDLAESALFAYGILHFPGRIPPADTTLIEETIPNRIEFIKQLIPPDQPIFSESERKPACK